MARTKRRRDVTAAERQQRRRDRLANERQVEDARPRGQGDGPAPLHKTHAFPPLPVHATTQNDGGDPSRWSAVPTVAPPAPDPNVTPPEGVTSPPPGPAAAVDVEPPGPTGEQLAGAAGAARAVLYVWQLGAAAVASLGESLAAERASPALVLACAQAAAHWNNELVVATIAGAAERCALKYGLVFNVAPPDEVVVGAALLVPVLAIAANHVRARRKRDVTNVTPGEDAPAPTPAPPASDWSSFGDIPAAGAAS